MLKEKENKQTKDKSYAITESMALHWLEYRDKKKKWVLSVRWGIHTHLRKETKERGDLFDESRKRRKRGKEKKKKRQ